MTPQTPVSPLAPPSPAATALATKHQLGALTSSFAPRRQTKPMLALYLFALFGAVSAFIVPGVFFFLWLRRMPEFSRKQAAKRLHLFEHGLVVEPQLGEGLTAVRWDSIRLYQDITLKIINDIPTVTTYVYTAIAKGSANATITDFYADPDTWGPRMQKAVARAQSDAALQSVLAGETVTFGPFDVTRAGLAAPAAGRLPWPALRELQLVRGTLRVLRTDAQAPWSTVPVRDIANIHLFLALAEHLRTL